MRHIRRNRWMLLILVFWVTDLFLLPWLQLRAVTGNLDISTVESDDFRQQSVSPAAMERVKELAEQEEQELGEVLAVFLIKSRFELTDQTKITSEEYYRIRAAALQYEEEAFRQLQNACEAVWSDIRCFPVAGTGSTVTEFEDSWMGERTYQGNRNHEGCDLFSREEGQEGETPGGVYPVISVTDGYVEKVGWLPLGGYRIGIRSKSGGYFYYAHLDTYARDFQAGDEIAAGEILGLMGDSGYGGEGTTGKFPVHLHFGIYFTTKEGKEISVNPYAALRCLENCRREYAFS